MKLRALLTRTAAVAAAAGLALTLTAGPLSAAQPGEQACFGEFQSESVTWINQFYPYFAQVKTDNLEPGSWANGDFFSIVALAQNDQGTGYGGEVQRIQSGAWSEFFPGLCVEP